MTSERNASGTAPTATWRRSDLLIAAALVVAGLALLLPNLGQRALWQDEAETALVARGILATGLPTAWDGRLLVTQAGGVELTDGFLWAWTPWAMHYVAASGMALFGETAFGARILFAVLGALSIGLTYLVALRLVRDRWVAGIAGLLLLSSVQYLLLMRQCRYYAIVPVAALVAILGYAAPRRRSGIALLAGGLLVLFHSNYAIGAAFALGLAAHALFVERSREAWLRLGWAGLVTLAGVLPWMLAVDLLERLGTPVAAREPFGTGLVKFTLLVNQYLVPWIVVGGIVLLRRGGGLRVRGAYGLFACMLVPAWVLLPAVLWANPRYVPQLFPLAAIVLACAAREVALRRRGLGAACVVLLAATNLLPALVLSPLPATLGKTLLDGEYATGPGQLGRSAIKREWLDYLAELSRPFEGPNEAIIRVLQDHAAQDDIVFAPYGELPIMFHAGLRHAGLLGPRARARPGWDTLPGYLWQPGEARWFVLRRRWLPGDGFERLRGALADRARSTGARLVAYDVVVQDTGWGNRPYLPYHPFRSPAAADEGAVVVLRLAD